MCQKGLHPLREIREIKVFKRQQQWTLKVGAQSGLIKSFLTNFFYILVCFTVFNSTNCYLGSLRKASLQKTKWRSTSVHFTTKTFKIFPMEGPRWQERRQLWKQDLAETMGNTIKASPCIQEPGWYCPQQSQESFLWEFTAEGNIGALCTQKVMVFACDLGTTDKHLASGQSA